MGSNLFDWRYTPTKLHSGGRSHFRVDCDALTLSDWTSLAEVATRIVKFGRVIGIPGGGKQFEGALRQHVDPTVAAVLIVDDVMTTGASFESMAASVEGPHVGVCVFARLGPDGGAGDVAWPSWVTPLFFVSQALDKAATPEDDSDNG